MSTHAQLVLLAALGSVSLALSAEPKPAPAAANKPAAANTLATANTPAAEHFASRVEPLLRAKCVGCHGDAETEAGLDLRSRASALKGGDSGPALTPGQPEKSLLFQAVTGALGEDRHMPPNKRERLTAEETAAVKRWIAEGAVWPEKPKAGAAKWASAGGDTWAFQPVRRPTVPPAAVPQVAESARAAVNPIDAFLSAKLAEVGLSAAGPTDRATLLRRLSVSLTGLPPTPEELAAFAADRRPTAVEAVVDRLLASPHFGEQQARHWLDVVRYADTSGFSNDHQRPNAWRYRDYVIRSFNADKPYDRFVLEQIAGDELAPRDPEMLLATGFLRMGPWEHTSMSVAAVTRQQFLDDVTNSTITTFLGLTIRCCRCHDHKFDPLPTADYYRIQACFASTQFAERPAAFLPSESRAGFESGEARARRQLQTSRAVLKRLRDKSEAALAEELRRHGVRTISELPENIRHNREFIGLSADEVSERKIHSKRIDHFEREALRYQPMAFTVYNGVSNSYNSNKAVNAMPANRMGPAPTVHVLRGGALESPGEPVAPGVLTAALGEAGSAWDSVPDEIDGRRLALARWIADARNPLTARVIVNRVWQQHFGRGLVATPNNFGKMGARPSHPELLDYLAVWFVEHGWSLKELHRLIATSAAFGRSSAPADAARSAERDPSNRLLGHFPIRRLAAEEIRDGMLRISGELNPTVGGVPAFPEINWDVALQPRHIMGSVAPAYQPSPTPEARNRRTVYAYRCRGLEDPLLEVLNRPGSEISCERRDETTVTPQVFALFNGQFAHDRALALAIRLEREAATLEGQIERAFRLVLGRAPTAEEAARGARHVAAMTDHHRAHPPTRTELPTVVKREMIEELTGEPVRWEEELDVLKAGYRRDAQPWQVGPETRALAELCLVLLNANEFLYLR